MTAGGPAVQREQQTCHQLLHLRAPSLHNLNVLAGRCVQGQNTSLCIIKPHIVRQGQAGAVLAALQQQFLITALQQFHIDAINAAGGAASACCEACARSCWYLMCVLPACCESICSPTRGERKYLFPNKGGAVHHLYCQQQDPFLVS